MNIMKKITAIQFWFMEWLINEKHLKMEDYAHLTDEEYEQLELQFIEYYQSIQ